MKALIRSSLSVYLILVSCFLFLLFSSTVSAATLPTQAGLNQDDRLLIQSLLPQNQGPRIAMFRSNGATVGRKIEYTIDRGNSNRIRAILKRRDLSPLVRNVIVSIPTQTKWGVSPVQGTVSTFSRNGSKSVQRVSCHYGNTAEGYIQDTNIYGIVLWSYDVKQNFNVDGTSVCGYGTRVPSFNANGFLTWKVGGETYSQPSLPSASVNEVNKGFFNPGYGLLPGEIGRVSLFMYAGGYWDVSVGIGS